MARAFDVNRVEKGHALKRLKIASNAQTLMRLHAIAAERDRTLAYVASFMVGTGVAAASLALDDGKPIEWPAPPLDPRYITATLKPLDMLDLIDVAQRSFESVGGTAAAMLTIGLQAYEAEQQSEGATP